MFKADTYTSGHRFIPPLQNPYIIDLYKAVIVQRCHGQFGDDNFPVKGGHFAPKQLP